MDYLSEIISFIAGAGISWAISFKIYNFRLKSVSLNQNAPTQNNNKVKNGSVVGRDQNNSH